MNHPLLKRDDPVERQWAGGSIRLGWPGIAECSAIDAMLRKVSADGGDYEEEDVRRLVELAWPYVLKLGDVPAPPLTWALSRIKPEEAIELAMIVRAGDTLTEKELGESSAPSSLSSEETPGAAEPAPTRGAGRDGAVTH